jgi:hypothetical protein
MIERAARRGLGLELKAARTCFATHAATVLPTRGPIPGASIDHIDGYLHGLGAAPVQRFVEGASAISWPGWMTTAVG